MICSLVIFTITRTVLCCIMLLVIHLLEVFLSSFCFGLQIFLFHRHEIKLGLFRVACQQHWMQTACSFCKYLFAVEMKLLWQYSGSFCIHFLSFVQLSIAGMSNPGKETLKIQFKCMGSF